MNYLTIKEIAKKWNITTRSVQNYCANNKIIGAIYIGKQWLIPINASKPIDGRTKNIKEQIEYEKYHFPLFIFSHYYVNDLDLNEEEKELKKAQLLYFSNKYIKAIEIFNRLFNNTINREIKFGACLGIGYCSLMLGLLIEYRNAIYNLQNIIKNEKLHKDDYQLLLNGLLFHVYKGKDEELIYNFPIENISSDALYYFNYLVYISTIIHSNVETKNSLFILHSFIKTLEAEGIIPLLIPLHCLLSALYLRINDIDKRKYHMHQAVDLAIKNNYLYGILKYYSVEFNLINECLINYDPKWKEELLSMQRKIMKNWTFMNNAAKNIKLLEEYSINQNEILFLISNDLSKESIPSIKNLSEKEFNNKLKEIYKISGCKNYNQLIEYSKKKFI